MTTKPKRLTEPESPHAWVVCMMCGPTIMCGTCGNNCCNGGRGRWPHGSDIPCLDCVSAHRKNEYDDPPPALVKEFESMTPEDRRLE